MYALLLAVSVVLFVFNFVIAWRTHCRYNKLRKALAFHSKSGYVNLEEPKHNPTIALLSGILAVSALLPLRWHALVWLLVGSIYVLAGLYLFPPTVGLGIATYVGDGRNPEVLKGTLVMGAIWSLIMAYATGILVWAVGVLW
jgi:hypothetical protein